MSPAEGEARGAFISLSGRVLPDWIDSNEHMNVARYDQVFDAAESAFYAFCGIDKTYSRYRRGLFRLEKHLRYQRELRLDAIIEVHTQILWTDMRRVQLFHQLWNRDENYRAATMECMAINMDLDQRRAISFDVSHISERIAAMAEEHGKLGFPEGVGRSVNRSPVHRQGPLGA